MQDDGIQLAWRVVGQPERRCGLRDDARGVPQLHLVLEVAVVEDAVLAVEVVHQGELDVEPFPFQTRLTRADNVAADADAYRSRRR